MGMKYQQFQQRLGNLAHEVATTQFKLQHLAQHLIHHNVISLPSGTTVAIGSWGTGADISQPIKRADLNDPYLGWLVINLQTRKDASFPLEPAFAGSSRQPDLASIELHDVYEIKPNTPPQRASGKLQLQAFKTLLQQGDREYVMNQQRYPSKIYSRLKKTTWTEGTHFLPSPQQVSMGPLGTVTLAFSRASPGLIVWEVDGRRQEVEERANSIAKDVVKVVQRFPNTEEEADRRARELLQGNTGLARAIAALVLTVGAAVVAIALAAAFSSLLAVGATTAVIFALAVGLSLNANNAARTPSLPRLA